MSMTEREYFEELRDITFANGRAKGYTVILPNADQIQLDIDRPWTLDSDRITTTSGAKAYMSIVDMIGFDKKSKQVVLRFLQEITVTKWEAWRSPGGNTHVMLTLVSDFHPIERVCLQLTLGSDPMREFLNFRRIICGAEDPIALFRPERVPTNIEHIEER